MRKSLWIAVLLIVLCIGLGVTGFVRLNESGKQIQYEETVLFGDKSAIDGLTVRHQLYTPILHRLYSVVPRGSGYLYWDTAYRPVEETAETEYTYREKKPETPVINREFLNFGTYSNGGMQTTGSIDLREDAGEWAPILIDVAEHAGTETRYTESVSLKDYFEYFPLFFDVKLGTLNSFSRSNVWDDDMEQWMKILQNMFRIPVPEKSYVTVEIHKRTDGSVYHYSISSEGSIPYFYSYSLITEKHCYLLVSVRVSDDEYADSSLSTELVREYQGIYRIPYETGSDDKTVLHLEEMEKIASLEHEMMQCIGVRYDEKWDRIELIYEGHIGGESPELMVFDAKTGEKLQTIPLTLKGESAWIRNIYHHDDFSMITLNASGEKNGFVLISRTDEGGYRKEFEAEFPKEETALGTRSDYLWSHPSYEISVDFDGKRLAIAMATLEDSGDDSSKNRIHLAVYEAGEMIFHGLYVSSLGIEEGNYDYYGPWNETPVRVSWD